MPVALLDDVLGTTSKVRILRRLCASPDRAFTGNALAREVGMSPNTVHRALKELAEAGVVDLWEAPHAHEARLTRETDVAEALLDLFRRERALRSVAVSALRGVAPDDVCIVLFGSFARGEATGQSDIDLLIVAPTYERATEVSLEARDALRDIVRLPVRSIAYTPGDLRRDRDLAFIRSILDEGVPASERTLEDIL